jgi:phage repressor protein C with HTH and peptisase S24 domain
MVPIELLEQEAAAGHGREVEDYPRRQPLYIPRSFVAPYRPDKLLAVYVSGDSMIEAGLNDGDIVIFHPGIKEGNGIYVLSERNSLLVKWVDFDLSHQTIVLISKNPLYQPRRFTGPELEEIKIAGRVLAWVHKP